MDALKAYFTSQENQLLFFFDGYRIEFQEWWFNVRPSNTEPALYCWSLRRAVPLGEKLNDMRIVLAPFMQESWKGFVSLDILRVYPFSEWFSRPSFIWRASGLDVSYPEPSAGHTLDVTSYGLGWVDLVFPVFIFVWEQLSHFAFRAKWKRSGKDTRRDMKDIENGSWCYWLFLFCATCCKISRCPVIG